MTRPPEPDPEAFENENAGTYAEWVVAQEYGLEHTPDEASWYDCRHPETGTKYEVKSARERVGEEYPADGRYRLWEDQHRSLTASDGQATAWYAFVLTDGSGNVVSIQRRRPSTVTAIVRERGGWNRAGHEERESRQHKLPHSDVF